MDGTAAQAAILAAVPDTDRPEAVVRWDPARYAAGEPIGIDRSFSPASADLWLGFVDLEPTRNWEHRALAVLVFADGRVDIVPIRRPPALPSGRRWQLLHDAPPR